MFIYATKCFLSDFDTVFKRLYVFKKVSLHFLVLFSKFFVCAKYCTATCVMPGETFIFLQGKKQFQKTFKRRESDKQTKDDRWHVCGSLWRKLFDVVKWDYLRSLYFCSISVLMPASSRCFEWGGSDQNFITKYGRRITLFLYRKFVVSVHLIIKINEGEQIWGNEKFWMITTIWLEKTTRILYKNR